MKIRTDREYRERMARRSSKPRKPAEPTPGVSTHPTPLDAIERVDNYQRQNGHRSCTNRQWQRIRHKEGRALARGVA